MPIKNHKNLPLIIRAEKGGMCSGVKSALELLERILIENPGKKVYVYNEIVHNRMLSNDLRRRGVSFVASLEEVPNDSILVFSAHGVGKKVENQARAPERNLTIFDASCPLVKKIHRTAQELEHKGFSIILIGHADHPEVIGIKGQLDSPIVGVINTPEAAESLPPLEGKIAWLCQTTFDFEKANEIAGILKNKYPNIVDGGGICYATRDRQLAIKKLAAVCEIVLVAGSRNSSNSNRLREIAARSGAPLGAYLISEISDLPLKILAKAQSIGIGSGASVPEKFCEEILQRLYKIQSGLENDL